MKKSWKYVVLSVASIILAGNLLSAYMRTLTEGPGILYAFETRNMEFEFTVDPAGGRDVAAMEQEFRKFLTLNPDTEDRELYRTFEMKPWQFWNWYQYFSSDLYEYPFKPVHKSTNP